MKKNNSTRIEVIHTIIRNEKQTALIRLVAGDVYDRQILVCKETGGRWKVMGFAFIPAKAHAEGKRDIWFERIDDGDDLQ